ncbi:hypothetical protein BGZ73_002329 [Actinomortierella ambigua]|nr:hypothetical protein BGZ73_002329 [Actinomortierella ambigua]
MKSDILEQRIQSLISSHQIMVFSKSYCPYSAAAKKLLRSYTDDSDEIKTVLTKLAHGHSTFPSIFLDKAPIGGSDNLRALAESGDLLLRLQRLGVHLKEGHP